MNQGCFTKIRAFFLFLKKCWGGLSPRPFCSGFRALRENLENQRKIWKICKVREKQANSRKFGKSQHLWKNQRKFFNFCSTCWYNNIVWLWKSKTRVTSYEFRVTSSNPRVTSSNSRVRRLKPRVARLKARVWILKARVGRLKAQVEAIKPRVIS